jgi:hypothetical protein
VTIAQSLAKNPASLSGRCLHFGLLCNIGNHCIGYLDPLPVEQHRDPDLAGLSIPTGET